MWSKDIIIVFIQTDFPDPVVPAINRCGIEARSAIRGNPEILLPSAIGSFISFLVINDKFTSILVAEESQKVELNKEIGSLLHKFNVHAATDVTGYGLIGHLYEMCKSSNVSAEIETNKVPFFNNVEQFAKRDAIPGGTKRNLEFYSKHFEFEDIGSKCE